MLVIFVQHSVQVLTIENVYLVNKLGNNLKQSYPLLQSLVDVYALAPSTLKLTEVVLLPKTGKNPRAEDSYRHIIGKMFEKYIKKKPQHFCNILKLTPNFQCVYSEKHSTIHHLGRLSKYII